MHKIIFVSIILLIGLFSLQMGNRASVQPYYGAEVEASPEWTPVNQVDTTDWMERYEVVLDSSGTYRLVERRRPIAL